MPPMHEITKLNKYTSLAQPPTHRPPTLVSDL